MFASSHDSSSKEKKGGPALSGGRVLRVKTGYNPNSSSIGSGIPKFLFFSIASGAATMALLHIKGVVESIIRRRKEEAGIEQRGHAE